MRSILARLATLTALFILLTGNAAAQETAPPAHFGLHLGLFQFELDDDDGYAPMIAGRASFPAATVLMIEGSLIATRPGQDVIGTTTMLIPEAEIQLALPFTDVVPYIGLGGGAAIDFRSAAAGGRKTSVTFAGSVGIKAWRGEHLGAQVEYRARAIGSGGGSSNEFLIGALWRV